MAEPAIWAPLYNRVKATVPGAVDADIRQEITAVLVDFLHDTNIWLETVDLAVVPDKLAYDFTLESGTPIRLMVVYDPASEPVGTARWVLNGITMRVPGTIRLPRQPQGSYAWKAMIAKAPSTPEVSGAPPKPTGYPVIDRWILERYADVLYYGTLWYLYRRPSKTYTNVEASKLNQLEYKSWKAKARADAQKMNVFNAQAWTYPQGWATVTRKGWA